MLQFVKEIKVANTKKTLEAFVIANVGALHDCGIDSIIIHTDYKVDRVRPLFNYYKDAENGKKTLTINVTYMFEMSVDLRMSPISLLNTIIRYIVRNSAMDIESKFFLSSNNPDKKDCWTFIREGLNR